MVLALTAALAGCANLAPDYAQPAAPVPASWTQQVDGKPLGVSAGKVAGEIDADQLGWREFFLDPRLQQVIAAAL
ncbi:multidrug transporter, partial [Acinetobacter baumannii]